ncbi:MAG TPA: 6,7-dimethyl-8-ribityllumazine synthase, partial [Acidobacteriaceae bacterium]|nr:6,7-dimethyl-8-ribityllumazine synthase [Acidobacteriaceae bacterium]
MIKGITLVHGASSDPVFEQLSALFTALGFEPGKGWQDATGRGAAFLAPIGNIELVAGRPPVVPPILVEVTALEDVHAIVIKHAAKHGKPSAIETTHWNSRLFTLEMGGLKLGFWQSENPLHGKVPAVEGDLSAEGVKFAIVVARWNAVITDRLLQGAFDAILRSGGSKESITVVRVPGAWEIPGAARTLAESKKHD